MGPTATESAATSGDDAEESTDGSTELMTSAALIWPVLICVSAVAAMPHTSTIAMRPHPPLAAQGGPGVLTACLAARVCFGALACREPIAYRGTRACFEHAFWATRRQCRGTNNGCLRASQCQTSNALTDGSLDDHATDVDRCAASVPLRPSRVASRSGHRLRGRAPPLLRSMVADRRRRRRSAQSFRQGRATQREPRPR